MPVQRVRLLVRENNALFVVVEEVDESARQHHPSSTAGQRERERLSMAGDLDGTGSVASQASKRLQHPSCANGAYRGDHCGR